MQTLGLNNQTNLPQNNLLNASKVGFWKRQFQMQTTYKQNVWDWIFGVIMPLICFIFDPIVFKGGFGGGALFGSYRPFAYVLCGACILTMSVWLVWREKLRWLSGFIAGLFFLGGAISLCVGIILFPFSLLGLFFLIGALGFTPLFTAVIYLRNAFRALHTSKMFLAREIRYYAFGFGIVFSVSLAWTINAQIKNSLENMIKGDAQTVYAEARKLKYLTILVNFDRLAQSYYRPAENEQLEEKMQAIADVFKQLTGEDIDSKAHFLMD